MGLLINALKVVGTVGLGAVAGVSKILAEANRKEGYVPEGLDGLTEACMNGIKKMWGEEVEEKPEKTIYDEIEHEYNLINNLQVNLEKYREFKEKAIESGRDDIIEKCNEEIINCKRNILEHRDTLFDLKKEAGEDFSESEWKSYDEYEDLSEE